MKKFIIVINTIALMVICSIYAFAYIDPAAVSYVAYAVSAIVIAVGALLTIFRHKIKAFFKKNKGEDKKREIHFTDDEDDE